MEFDISSLLGETPVFTGAFLIASTMLTVLVNNQQLSPNYLYLNGQKILSGQVWRLFTPMMLFSYDLDFNFLFQLFFLFFLGKIFLF